ncbi:MAG: hypothetical protein QXU72_08265 [Thermofilum sp.]
MGCEKCRYLHPSPVHEHLAYCARCSTFVSWPSERCASIEPWTPSDLASALEKGALAYCLACRATLTSGEVEEHAARGHPISLAVLGEELLEEVYAGD